jgi:hypothetical protein
MKLKHWTIAVVVAALCFIPTFFQFDDGVKHLGLRFLGCCALAVVAVPVALGLSLGAK